MIENISKHYNQTDMPFKYVLNILILDHWVTRQSVIQDQSSIKDNHWGHFYTKVEARNLLVFLNLSRFSNPAIGAREWWSFRLFPLREVFQPATAAAELKIQNKISSQIE